MRLNSFLCICLSFMALAEASEPPVLANHLFARDQYDEAITEYKRYIYHQRDSELLDLVFFQIARAYRYQGDLNQSYKHLDLALDQTTTPSLVGLIDVEKAINHLAEGNICMAISRLEHVLDSTKDKQAEKYALFYLSLAEIMNADYSAARNHFGQYILDDDIAQQEVNHKGIVALLDSAAAVTYKDTQKAKLLSSFLPGLGQIYCESYQQGINAFLINGSMAALVTYALLHGNYINAVVFGVVLKLFYSGNRYRTGVICDHNINDTHHWLQMKIISDILNGMPDSNDLELYWVQ